MLRRLRTWIRAAQKSRAKTCHLRLEALDERCLLSGAQFNTGEWANWWTYERMQVLAGDFNGDRRADVMKFDVQENGSQGTNGLWVGLANGSGFDTAEWSRWVTSSQTKVLAGDFNGDGRTDVMKFDVLPNGAQATNGLWVGLSYGSGFDTYKWSDWVTSAQTKVLAGDFNGDGRTDVMKFDVRENGSQGSNGLWVGLSNGSGFDTYKWADWVTSSQTKVLAGDFNGDGRTDVMKFDVRENGSQGTNGLWVGLSNGSGFDTYKWADWVTSAQTKVLAGDFNGDGRTDVMKFDVRENGSQGSNGLWVGLSNGSGFDTSKWADWVTSSLTKVLAGDFNGDGRTDVMKFDVSGSSGPGGLWVGLANNAPLQLEDLSATYCAAGQSGCSATIGVSGGSFLYRNLTVTGLPPGLSATLSGDRITFSGTPTQAGTFNAINVSLQDSRGTTARRTYGLTVNLGLTPASLPTARVGQSYSTTFRAVGGSGAYTYALASGSLPAGLSLSSNGVLSGVPTRAGGFNFTVRATDVLRAGLTGTGGSLLNVLQILPMPTDQHQDDSWSCGPNSIARLLRSYGYNVSYDEVRRFTRYDGNLASRVGMGTPSSALIDSLRNWKSDARREDESNMGRVEQLLLQGTPLIALVSMGRTSIPLGNVARMHYLVLNGIDTVNHRVFYTNTNGAQGWWTYAEFQHRWNWHHDFTGVSGEAAQAFVGALGMRERTIFF